MDEGRETVEGGRMEHPAVSGRLRQRRSVRNELTQAARSFRKAPTASEMLLWHKLRRNQLQGCTFRRQHPIGPFIVDFCCPRRNVIVEIDGPIHAGQGAADAERQRRLEAQGYTIVRLTADEVETRMADALHRIAESLND